MAIYGTFLYGEDVYSGSGSSVPELLSEGRIPWIFQALDSGDSYEFAINPLDVSIPSVSKTISIQPTAAGANVIFQGRNKIPVMSFSGTILTEDHYNAMEEWTDLQKQVSLRDDLGYRYWIYLKSFSPTRVSSIGYPWHHEFSCEAIVLDWD